MSVAPSMASAKIDSHDIVETPKTTVIAPHRTTAISIITPAWLLIGWPVSQTATMIAPMPGAARNRPSPHGPSSRISRA
jgi:hypothetical protein